MDARPLDIVLAYDGDAAGLAATEQVLDRIAREAGKRFRPPAEWELDGELEFWRAMHAAALTPDAEAWTRQAVEDLEQQIERRRHPAYPRQSAPFDLRETVQRIKDRADILAVFGSRAPHCTGTARPQSSTRTVMLCPLHSERTGSLVIYRDQQAFWCYGCRQGGDVIAAAMLLDDIDFVTAVRTLADEFGVEMPKRQIAGGVRRVEP